MQYTQLLQQLRSLRVPGMVEALEQQLEQPATHSDLSFEQRLNLMIDRELTYRSNNKIQRLLKTASLKLQAYPEDIDYQHPRGLDKNQFASLLSCQWIEQHQNVLITGPTGCGKTYLGCVLATQACQLGYSVRYYRSSRLLESLSIAHGDGRFTKLINQIAKTDLLVLDDWGLEALTLGQRNDVLELMEDRHGSRSTLITSQVPVKNWHAAIGDPTLADAILDRLLHNAHRLQLKGDSMRKVLSDLTGSI
jgi:DNA replication protein DnaC